MNRRNFQKTVLVSTVGLISSKFGSSHAEQAKPHYQADSVIDLGVGVVDAQGVEYKVLDLLQTQRKPVTVLFIFGGGAMGNPHSAGGIWCPDSFEDLHILRSLVDKYQQQIGFLAVACPPVFHTKRMGFADRAFFDFDDNSEQYKLALEAFIKSTNNAVAQGIIPIQPYFDPRFRLLMSAAVQQSLVTNYGRIPSWQGAFRAQHETQSYGVPNFWLLSDEGKVLGNPFRGNLYHPHGDEITINYSLLDIVSVINAQLRLS